MADVHFRCTSRIWLYMALDQLLRLSNSKQNWYLTGTYLLQNTMKTDQQLWEFLWKLSFSEKQNRRMIIGLFAEIIKLNENKNQILSRVKN